MSDSETTNKDDIKIPATSLYDAKANKIIRNYSLAASGSGLIPSSILSAAGVTGIQVFLIKDLCELYNIPFTEKRINVILNSILGSAATRLIALVAMAIPGISAPMKGLTGATIAGLYTATVGEFYKVHFQNGGTIENASIGDLTRYIIEEYHRGGFDLNSMTNPGSIIKRAFNKE